MAIISITIVQDNKRLSCPLLSVHNPLVFIVEVNYTSTAPDLLYVRENIQSKTYSCIPYSDPQPGKRQFMFIADEIIRGLMGDFDDIIQADDTVSLRTGKSLDIAFTFYDPDAPTTDVEIAFTALHASRQFGENPSLNSIELNETEAAVGIVGFHSYAYAYTSDIVNPVTVTVN